MAGLGTVAEIIFRTTDMEPPFSQSREDLLFAIKEFNTAVTLENLKILFPIRQEYLDALEEIESE